MAKITVSSGAVVYDGRLLYAGGPYTVNDTYENNVKAQKDVAAGLITIIEAFTVLSPESQVVIPTIESEDAPVNAVAASLTTELTGDNNDLVFTAKKKGVSYINVAYIDPGEDTAACSAALTGSGTAADPYVISVTLKYATNAITATAADVKAAVEASAACAALVTVANAASNNGTGVVTALEATALEGGVNGTIAEAGVAMQDGSYLYIATADNTINDANWRRVPLGSAY